jgi:hypothetical protein
MRAYSIKIECIRESHLLYLKGFLTDFLLSYRNKNLNSRVHELFGAIRRTMGVECVLFAGFDVPKTGLKTI